MYVLKSIAASSRDGEDPAHDDAASVRQPVRNGAPEPAQTVIYLDPRAFTRDCVGGWFQSTLSGFSVRVFQDPSELEGAPDVNERIRAVIINTGPERISSVNSSPRFRWRYYPSSRTLRAFERPSHLVSAATYRRAWPRRWRSRRSVSFALAARSHQRSRYCAKAALCRVQWASRRSRALRSGSRRSWTACNVAWRTS